MSTHRALLSMGRHVKLKGKFPGDRLGWNAHEVWPKTATVPEINCGTGADYRTPHVPLAF